VDFKVASSIYRKPWLIEPQAAISYVELLEQMKAGTNRYEKPEATTIKLFANNADVVMAPDNRFTAQEHPGYEGKSIAILPISGALMKEDFCGWFGTASLRNELNKINATQSIKTIIFHIDSPGGTVDGTEALGEAIRQSGKETVAVIDGMACSAAYWLASSADKIIATGKTDVVGSIGTMISFYDRSQYMEEQGIVLREFYADASKDKNKMYRKAMDGDGKLLIEQMLNPTNDIFLDAVKSNRGEKLNQKETLTGKTFLAEKALELGLIDQISSMDQVIGQYSQKHKNSLIMKSAIKATFKNIFSFLGIIPAEGAETVELSEDHLNKIEAALPELESSRAKVIELEAAAVSNQARITELEGQLQTVSTERDGLKTKNQAQQTEIERLGNLDAGKITTTGTDQDPKTETVENPLEMEFEKEIRSRLD
jgi:signal peptide peptidase SppA